MKKVIWLFTSFLILITSSYAFSDVDSSYWANNIIKKWTNNGVMSGYADGTFKPNGYITKAELVSIINNIDNSDATATKRPSKDIKVTDWYCQDMAVALRNGIVELDSNGNLNPQKILTKEEAITMLAKFLGLKYTGDINIIKAKFKDISSVSDENLLYVAAMINEGYVIGNNGKINPKNKITRVEVVSILDNMIEEIYTSGEFSNRVINGNLVINGEGVKLSNIQVNGYIYMKNGSSDNFNVYATKGILSNGKVISYNDGTKKYDNLSNIEEERSNAQVQFVKIIYSETDWTNKSVTATLKFDNKDMEIINNKGKNKYKFTKNGEFTFICEDSNGNEYRYTAKVDNIAKKDLEIELDVQDNTSNATVTVKVLKNEAPIKNIYFISGKESISETLDSGEKVLDNQFTVTETNTYTVAIEDEAGNTVKKEFYWKNTAKHMINVIQNVGGKITPESLELKHHDNASFSIMADTENGYYLKDVLVDGVSKGAITEYTFTDIREEHKIEAVFKLHTYDIEVIQAENGKIEPITSKVDFGSSQTFKIIPDEGYEIVDVLVDGVSVGTDNIYEFVDVREAHTITASFKVKEFNIIVEHSANGVINPGSTSVEYGEEITFFVQPDTGYEIKDVIVDNVSVGPNLAYTFKEVKEPHTIVAIFEEIPHTGILETVQIGEKVYATIYDDFSCTVFGLGKTDDFTYPFIDDKHPLGEYGSLVKNVDVKLGVENIGDSLFADCKVLQFVDLPSSVETFGINSFRNCESLKEIVIPDNSKQIKARTFYNCKSLDSIIIPDSVELIGVEAFSGCVSIETITMPKNLKTLEAKAFYNCSSLIDNVAIPDGTEKIGEETFYNCDLLASVTIPSSIKSIGNNAFDDCNILKSLMFTNRKNINDLGRGWYPNGGDYKENVVGNNYVITRTSFTITVINSANGVIEPATLNAKKSENYKFRLTPENGYEVEDIIVDGFSVGAANEYEFVSVNSTHTITAKFKPAEYKIKYNLNGGTLLVENPESYTSLTGNFTLNNPEKEGYEFDGWTGTGLDGNVLNVSLNGEFGDKEFTATWKVIEYTIKYEMSGGTADNPTSYTIETPDISLKEALREGYEFIGWKTEGIDVATKDIKILQGSIGDKTYTAEWKPIKYTITYELNNGYFNGTPTTAYDIESSSFTLMEPIRPGYTFTGWTGEGLASGSYSVIIATGTTGNRTYYANWEATWYKIEYDLAGGSNSSDNPDGYTILTPNIVLKEPTKAGYTFVGWIDEEDTTATVKQTITIPIGSTGNKKFKAIWQQ